MLFASCTSLLRNHSGSPSKPKHLGQHPASCIQSLPSSALPRTLRSRQGVSRTFRACLHAPPTLAPAWNALPPFLQSWQPSPAHLMRPCLSVHTAAHLFLFLFLFLSFGRTAQRAGRILVPQPGVEPTPPEVEAQGLNHWTAREVPNCCPS